MKRIRLGVSKTRSFCIAKRRQRFWEIDAATIEDLAFGVRSSRAKQKRGQSPFFIALEKRGLSPFLIASMSERSELRSRQEERMEMALKIRLGARLFPKTLAKQAKSLFFL
jgi:hypothetical protein